MTKNEKILLVNNIYMQRKWIDVKNTEFYKFGRKNIKSRINWIIKQHQKLIDTFCDNKKVIMTDIKNCIEDKNSILIDLNIQKAAVSKLQKEESITNYEAETKEMDKNLPNYFKEFLVMFTVFGNYFESTYENMKLEGDIKKEMEKLLKKYDGFCTLIEKENLY